MSEIQLPIGAWFMPEVRIRKRFISVEEIFHEGGPVAACLCAGRPHWPLFTILLRENM